MGDLLGGMIPMKREKMLTIRVTDEEHARLLERCEGKRLAEWMRRVCLGEPVARTGKLPTLAQARKCTMLASVTLPLPRPLAHYVRSLGLRRAVGSLSL